MQNNRQGNNGTKYCCSCCSSWLHMRPAIYRVSNLLIPIPSFTLSIYLPPLPTNTTFAFPTALSTNISRVTWDCMNAQNCIRSSVPGSTIEGISFRNVLIHAIRHVGTMEQSTDLTLNQVDCRDSGGLLYKTNGSVAMNQVELVNATNYPGATGFQSSVSLVHIVNANVSIIDSRFRDCQINGSFKYPSSTMSIVSPSTFISFTMLRSEIRNNLFQTTFPAPKGVDSQYCNVGPGLTFNVSFINIRIDSCDFADNTAYGDRVCGAGIGVFPFSDPDPSHSVDIQISSSRFLNNSLLNTYSSDGVGILVNYSGAATAPVIRISNCSFLDQTGPNSYYGGVVGLRRTKLVSITDCYFSGNIIRGIKLLDMGFSGSILLQNNIFDGNNSPVVAISIIANLTIKNSIFRNGIGLHSEGAATLFRSDYAKVPPQVTIDSCLFSNNSGGLGGGLSLKDVTAVISQTNFLVNYAHEGGAVGFLGSTGSLTDCLFQDNYVISEVNNYLSGSPAQGGAIFAVSSSLSISSSRIVNSTFQSPNGIQACESASRGAIVSSSPRGGAFSLFQSSLLLEDCSIEGSYSCIGGDIYANGETIYITSTTISNSRAMLGGSCAMKEGTTFFTYDATFTNVSSQSNGGAIIVSTVNQVLIRETTFDTVQSITGDGGVIHLSDMSTISSVSADGITFLNCSAPTGGGALAFFSSVNGGAVYSFDFTDEESMNTIVPPEGQYVEWGELEATNVVLITSDVQSVSLYPGQHFSESQHATPFNISILAFDMFNQTVLGDRGMVIQCSLMQADVQKNPKAILGGTTLQQMTSARAAAVFDDLFITAEPGEYQLIFSVVGTPSIQSIIVSVHLRSQCPSTLFYKKGICTSCPTSLQVYDPSADACVSCNTGRVATSEGKCAICDLGYSNYGSPTCVKCPSNMYQPNPFAPCISCLGIEMDGLSCSDGLAEVQPGYFAFSVFLDGATTPSIRTVQCPSDGYCNGAPLQSNWSDPMNELINGSASTVVPTFDSAITRFDQCAYPSLASETNYLCGQCAPGLIVWGSKCSKCDQIDGGRMTLFIFLSFALVIFLVRASLASASAGHSTILLYFIQTAILEIGSSSNLIGWLNLGLLSPSSFSDCVAPLDVYQQSTFQLLMPLFLLGELLVVMTLHYMWFRFRSQDGAPPNSASQGNPSLLTASALRSRFLSVIDSFSIDLYISAGLSVLLFTYTQMLMESFRMLTCVDVAGVRVVFTQPTMRCDSDEYKRHMVLVGIVIAYVGFLPLAISIFLWRNNNLVQMSHELMKLEDPNADATMSEYQESPSSSNQKSTASPVPKPALNESVSHFLLRYSAVFSMYSGRAWFWKGILLSRRIVFAAISVSLVRRPNMRFFAFSFAHLVSLLLQGYFKPFERDFFNWMEIASHVVLIVLSQSLTAILPPYPDSTEVYLFVIIVLSVGIYALVVMIERYVKHRHLRSIEQIIFARGSIVAGRPEQPKNVGGSDHPGIDSQPSHLTARDSINGSPLGNEESVEMNNIRQHIGDHKLGHGEEYAPNAGESSHVLPLEVKRSESVLFEDSAAL